MGFVKRSAGIAWLWGGGKPLFDKELRREKNSAKPHFRPVFGLFRRRFADILPARNRVVA